MNVKMIRRETNIYISKIIKIRNTKYLKLLEFKTTRFDLKLKAIIENNKFVYKKN